MWSWLHDWSEVVSLIFNMFIVVWGFKKYLDRVHRQYVKLLTMVDTHDMKLDTIIQALATSRTLAEAQSKISKSVMAYKRPS